MAQPERPAVQPAERPARPMSYEEAVARQREAQESAAKPATPSVPRTNEEE